MLFKFILFFGILLFTSFSGYVTTQVLPGAEKAFRVLNAACDAIMFAIALSVVIRHRRAGVVRWLLFFLTATTITVIINLDKLSFPAQLNGLRQPLFVLSSLVVMYDLLMSDRSQLVISWMDRFLVVFALVQFPLSLYQFLKYGAGDAVGGTYGLSGGSGMVTLLLFVITFYLLVRHGSVDDGESFAVSRILPFSLLLAPVALNETKISFVFLAMFLGFLVLSRRKFYKIIPILAFGAFLAFMLKELYTESVRDPSDFLLDERFLERYLVYDPRAGIDIPRFQKLAIMFNEMTKQPIAWLVGYGYGLFVGENILGQSPYVRSFWYIGGTRPSVFSIWMQGGAVAVIGMAGAMFSFLFRRINVLPTVARFGWFLAAVLLVALVYNEAWLNRPFALIIGYLSTWLVLLPSGSEAESAELTGAMTEIPSSMDLDDDEIPGLPRES